MPSGEGPSSSAKKNPLRALFARLGGFDPDQKPAHAEGSVDLVDQAEAFQELTVEDVMTPRADIVAVEVDTSLAELVKVFVEAEHSRLPIYRETLDDPTGVVHIKDVVRLIAPSDDRPAPNWSEPDRKSTRLNSSHTDISRMPSSA